MEFHISVERGGAALENLVPHWEELAAQALEPNPLYEHWMLRPALELLVDGQAPELLCVWRRGKLRALLPVQSVSRYKGLPVRALSVWRHRHCLIGTPLLHPDDPAQALAALLRWMKNESRASVLEFNYFTAGGPFHQALVDALNECGMRSRAADSFTRGVLRRDRDAEAYITSAMSADSRGKLRRVERRLQEQGELRRRTLQPGDDVGRWIGEFLRVEASGWKGQRGSALVCNDRNRQFGTEVFTRAFERGRLVMVGLDLDGRPIARYTAFVAGEGAFVFKTAYEEEFRKFSPGILAELEMIRAFHEREGVQWMDSLTTAGNSTIDRLWRHRCVIQQQLAVGIDARGALAIAAVPLLKWLAGLAPAPFRRRASGPRAVRPMPAQA